MKPENDNREPDINLDGVVAIALSILGVGCVVGTVLWLALGDHVP